LLPPCEGEPEPADPSPLELLLSSEPELELELELESLDVAVVPVLLPECFDDTTATETPVAPMPRTAVAIAAADARWIQRRLLGWDSSVVTMQQASAEAAQPHSKRRSSHRQVLLKAL
jgi:hypothetical protein